MEIDIVPWEKESQTVLRLTAPLGIVLRTGENYVLNPTRIDIGIEGWGGVDKLPAQKWSMYYIYILQDPDDENGMQVVATRSGRAFSLIGTMIGFFTTDGNREITFPSNKVCGIIGDVKKTRYTEDEFFRRVGPGWVPADGRSVVGSKYPQPNVPVIPDDEEGKRSYVKVA